ncbi:hypothetical protein BVRB_8g199190 [Beta vulgaris subsp. vulgaris]|nr:hypothetical protein BVRB_8g199190 [Beta vulgaris subsp. vulgaris]
MAKKFILNLSPLIDALFETDDDGKMLLNKDICDSFGHGSPWPRRFYESGGAEHHMGPSVKKALESALDEQLEEMEGFQLGEARPKLPPNLAVENVEEDSDCQMLEDFTFSDDSSLEGEREIIDIDSEEEEQEKLGFLERTVKLEKIMVDEVMHDVVEDKKQGSSSVRRPYMLRSCSEICMLLKKGVRMRVKGRRFLWVKGKGCCRWWEDGSGVCAASSLVSVELM